MYQYTSNIVWGFVGTVLALAPVIMAFRECGRRGKIFLVVIVIISFILPPVFKGRTVPALCFAGRLILGIACLFYLKLSSLRQDL